MGNNADDQIIVQTLQEILEEFKDSELPIHYTVAEDLNGSLASEVANGIKMSAGIPQITFGFTISQCITGLTSYYSLIDQIFQANNSVC